MLDDLRALVEFAQAGSIAGAAERLFRTPSAKQLGVPLPKTWNVSAAFSTNARSATTTSCSGTAAVSRSRPSGTASASPEPKCSSWNLSKGRSRSTTETPNSSTPGEKFTQGMTFLSGRYPDIFTLLQHPTVAPVVKITGSAILFGG